MYCTRCGHRNPDSANFCASCGATLQALEEQTMALHVESVADESSPSLEGLGEGQALLVIKGGPTAGSTVLVDRDSTRVGRHPESD
ncbi:MAG TPA: zinc-ribbon domain-containing protein, partial [Actinomycetota bacterium]|nr:zinc-ribbon domain-containing protein [Actinomycetota bacterium]